MAEQIVQEIKDRLDIAEVIGGYIPVKKAGTNFKALCPFHGEKTPSFVVTPSRQIWHCFGCGEGGDVFTFVQKFENLTFPETLKLLADRTGVKLPEFKTAHVQDEDEKDLLVRINTFAARYYHELLLADARGREALEYLSQRGLSVGTIKAWQIGYAPEGFQNLADALRQKNVLPSQAIKAGVLVKNDKGNTYDRFRGRVTFPIFNYLGDIVGFSARILPKLDDGKSGKYINSPETLIYSKSKVLFGLNFAKNHIRKNDEVIIVEGQMDCIAAHQAGFANTVASSGTALTQEQLTVLGRLSKNLKFCFDADAAGLNATRRAVENYIGKDFNIKIVELAGAKDPDELIRKNPAVWEKAVENARLFLDYYIDKLFENFSAASIERKKQIKDEILPLVGRLNDPLEQDHYLQLLAKKFGTVINVLKQSLQKIPLAKYPGLNPKVGSIKPQPVKINLFAESEKLVLGGMLSDQFFLNQVLREGVIEDFITKEVKDIAEVLFANQPLPVEVLSSTLAKEVVFMVELRKEESSSTEAFQKDLTKAFFALRAANLSEKRQVLQARVQAAEEAGDMGLVMNLQKEFSDVSKLINYYKL